MTDFGHLKGGPSRKMDIDQLFCILLLPFVSLLSIIMVDYQRMGNGGTRPATVTLNNHALVYFKEFLQSKDIVDKRSTRQALWEFGKSKRVSNVILLSPNLGY